jgi:hypothetical protein
MRHNSNQARAAEAATALSRHTPARTRGEVRRHKGELRYTAVHETDGDAALVAHDAAHARSLR